MQRKQVMSQSKIPEHGICHICAGGLPPAGIKPLQPYSRPLIQMRNGTGNLAFNNIGCQVRLIISRSLIPFHCPEIVSELRNILSPSTMITPEGHPPAFMPLINRPEIFLFAQLHDNIIIIQTDFRSFFPGISKKSFPLFCNIIALSFQKFLFKIIRPQISPDIKI